MNITSVRVSSSMDLCMCRMCSCCCARKKDKFSMMTRQAKP